MLECLILGDSIAKGISDVRKECVAYVKSGINSTNFLNNYGNMPLDAKTVIISLGSNDFETLHTFEAIHILRQRVEADRVIWIIPNIKDTKRSNVKDVAKIFNDMVIDARNYSTSSDKVHPTGKGYRDIAKDTK